MLTVNLLLMWGFILPVLALGIHALDTMTGTAWWQASTTREDTDTLDTRAYRNWLSVLSHSDSEPYPTNNN